MEHNVKSSLLRKPCRPAAFRTAIVASGLALAVIGLPAARFRSGDERDQR